MTVIRQEDFIASVAGALQYISYYHPEDYIRALAQAYEHEQSPLDAMAQILINSRMCCEGNHGTGIVNAPASVDVHFESGPGERTLDLQQMVDAGVRHCLSRPTTEKLRASLQSDPTQASASTPDNMRQLCSSERPQHDRRSHCRRQRRWYLVGLMTSTNDSVVDWVLETVHPMGAGWCPPGILGIISTPSAAVGGGAHSSNRLDGYRR